MTIKLTKEEYKRISQSLIQLIKDMLAQDPDQKITSELLALHLIESQLSEFTELDQMQK